MFPPFEAIKLFFTGAKGLFILGFVVLFAFLLLSHSCSHHKPDVSVIESPPIESSITPAIVENNNAAIVADQQHQTDTTAVTKTAKVTIHKKIAVINSNKALAEPEREKQIGEAQISNIEAIYASYYPQKPVPAPTASSDSGSPNWAGSTTTISSMNA